MTHIRRVVLTAGLLAAALTGAFGAGLEVSSGVSALLYQSVFSYQLSTAVEAAIAGDVAGPLRWQAGARVGIDRPLPEGFVRLEVSPAIGPWQPFVGLEAGITTRPAFEPGSLLLQEMRNATEGEISPLYVAVIAAPLSFRIFERWRVSVLEVAVGTHVSALGRTMRVQAGIISAGVTL